MRGNSPQGAAETPRPTRATGPKELGMRKEQQVRDRFDGRRPRHMASALEALEGRRLLSGDVVIDWNELLLQSMQNHVLIGKPLNPTQR